MQRNTLYLVLLIAVLSLMACTVKTQRSKGLSSTDLGINLTKENCWMKSGSMLEDTVDMPGELFNIYCGDWEWPSARIFKIANDSIKISTWWGDNVWRRTLYKRMYCADDIQNRRSLPLLNTDMIVLDCKLNNGSWPYLALIVNYNGSTYLSDGIPSSIVAIQQAIAILSGTGDLPVDYQNAAKEYVQQYFQNRLYSTNDLQAYYEAMISGQYYNSIKSFAKAEAAYWQALKHHQKALGTDNNDIGDVLMHIALESSNQEQFTEAIDMFVKSTNKIDIAKSPDDDARLLSYQALHFANQGEFEIALTMANLATKERFKKGEWVGSASGNPSLGLMKQTNLYDYNFMGLDMMQSAPVEAVHSLYVEAAMQNRLGRNKVGKRVLERAKYILSSSEEVPPLWEPQLDSLDGVIATSLQQKSQAHNKAFTLFHKRAPGKRPSILSLVDLGKLSLTEHRDNEAIKLFREAIDLALKRNNSFRLSQLEPYLSLQLGNRNDPEEREEVSREMFAAAQLVQGGITAKEIAKTVARFGKKAQQQESSNKQGPIINLIGDLQKQEYQRVKKQREYQVELRRVFEDDHKQRLEDLNSELDKIDQKIDDLNQKVKEDLPEYRQLINSAVNTDDVINALTENEALLQVLVGKEHSYVFFILKKQGKEQKIIAYSVPLKASEISSTVDLLRKTIRKTDREILQVADKAHDLYIKLFGPVADEINTVSHLITVPSGPLLSFPFELFVTETPPKISKNYYMAEIAKIAWLIKRTTISLVPSAQSFVYLRQHASRSTAPKSLIAFGNFIPSPKTEKKKYQRNVPVCQSNGKVLYSNFKKLGWTSNEVNQVASKFPSVSEDDLFLEARFTEQAVKNQDLKNYRIIYFATHTFLPDKTDCKREPSLITSIDMSEKSNNDHTTDNNANDGFLTTGEISELDLNADLVVLSACNTAPAYQAQGESLSGLARAFFFAGTRSLLVSHWQIDDEATAELMTLVFDFLKKKPTTSIADALKMAQLKMLKKPRKKIWAHPYYWAGFSLVGDGKLSMPADIWKATR